MVKQKYNLSLSTGVGYQHYKDKSFVYGKPRDVSMNKLAYNLSAGGEYRLSPLVGISAKIELDRYLLRELFGQVSRSEMAGRIS